MVELLQGHGKLREILGLEAKLPHDTALPKFSKRSDVTAIAGKIIAESGQAALRAREDQGVIAIDSTGLESTTASAHYLIRSGKSRKSDVKLSLSIVFSGRLAVVSACRVLLS